MERFPILVCSIHCARFSKKTLISDILRKNRKCLLSTKSYYCRLLPLDWIKKQRHFSFLNYLENIWLGFFFNLVSFERLGHTSLRKRLLVFWSLMVFLVGTITQKIIWYRLLEKLEYFTYFTSKRYSFIHMLMWRNKQAINTYIQLTINSYNRHKYLLFCRKYIFKRAIKDKIAVCYQNL